MGATVYVNADTAYTRPADLIPYAQHGAGYTAAEQANANVIHKEARRIYDRNEILDATLKQEAIAAV